MTPLTGFFLILGAVCIYAKGNDLGQRENSSVCGDWTPFLDKCYKVIETAGTQNQQDAELMCKSFAEEERLEENDAKLITIQSHEEQEFLENFLFVEKEIVDSVWLGLTQKENSSEFIWNDGISIDYSNWADQTITDDHHNCVEMESGEGTSQRGLWFRVNCHKRIVVVCEKPQSWTLEKMQLNFLKYKKQMEKELRETKLQLQLQSQDLTASNDKIRQLQENPVPSRFVYAQLPGQFEPTTLWPQLKWEDISNTYAGLFFRVLGGNAPFKSEPFNSIQEGNAPTLRAIESQYDYKGNEGTKYLSPGSWSGGMVTGGSDGKWCSLDFLMNSGEVRPRNKAIKIWQRIG